MSELRPGSVPALAGLALALLLGTACGDSGKEYATNLGEAIDRGKATGVRGDMQSIAAALTSYMTQEAELPTVSDIHALADLLEPTYSRHVPVTDAWGTDYRLESDGSDYSLRSAGQDQTWETPDDLVMQNGQMTQMPAGFQRL